LEKLGGKLTFAASPKLTSHNFKSVKDGLILELVTVEPLVHNSDNIAGRTANCVSIDQRMGRHQNFGFTVIYLGSPASDQHPVLG